MYMEIALLILVSILIVLVIFCIPVVLKIWCISKDIAITLQSLNQSFPLILKNLEDITTNVNSASSLINKKIQDIASASDRSSQLLSDVVNNIQNFAPIALNMPIFRIIRNAVAVAKGMRVFVEVLLNKEKAETLK
ncbi:MAG: hypothetical protein JW976_13750 [Syntrophaceae bacterium]|nr:hypothetical protein [Syntrophaceae bacterium]